MTNKGRRKTPTRPEIVSILDSMRVVPAVTTELKAEDRVMFIVDETKDGDMRCVYSTGFLNHLKGRGLV